MAYRLSSERVSVTVDDLTIEVERIVAEPVYMVAVALVATVTTAKPQGQYEALRTLYGYFVTEAQPTWAIADHRGVVLPTQGGMLRLPIAIGLRLVEAWTDDFDAEPPATAADAVLPPGPARDEVNRTLRRKRK